MKIVQELIDVSSGLFYSPKNLEDALNYVVEYARNSNDEAAVMMATQILLNGIASQARAEIKETV
jgi:hypothetical protein